MYQPIILSHAVPAIYTETYTISAKSYIEVFDLFPPAFKTQTLPNLSIRITFTNCTASDCHTQADSVLNMWCTCMNNKIMHRQFVYDCTSGTQPGDWQNKSGF